MVGGVYNPSSWSKARKDIEVNYFLNSPDAETISGRRRGTLPLDSPPAEGRGQLAPEGHGKRRQVRDADVLGRLPILGQEEGAEEKWGL